ncbi:thermonuclease family protein [Agriterribacter sp.]|uniref:thermonuclease family protein n=1 Tax=Agriterribacter sp. TaxID=2821509 RepID=UPI002C922553|nr:thermonuclease family protein [Agriterribacter sp.]HTN06309.1 thermonuclease family protein [Agriterribacter sp.]
MIRIQNILLLCLLGLSCFAQKQSRLVARFTGEIIKIVDGDTYDLLMEDHTVKRIRMEGIDAPERGMPYYKQSREYLGALCFRKMVTVIQTGKDRNGRIIARTLLPGVPELGWQMVNAGYAWHFKKYSASRQLAKAETRARKKRIGLWADKQPVAPWEWRKRPRPGK